MNASSFTASIGSASQVPATRSMGTSLRKHWVVVATLGCAVLSCLFVAIGYPQASRFFLMMSVVTSAFSGVAAPKDEKGT